MPGESKVTVRVNRRFNASAERVFDAWLDPGKASRFLFATPTGQIVRCEIDPRAGGSFVIVRRDGEDIEHTGEYLEIERPVRLVFTFGAPKFSKETTRVAIDIVPMGAACELTLTHDAVLAAWAAATEAGWRMILSALDAALPSM